MKERLYEQFSELDLPRYRLVDSDPKALVKLCSFECKMVFKHPDNELNEIVCEISKKHLDETLTKQEAQIYNEIPWVDAFLKKYYENKITVWKHGDDGTEPDFILSNEIGIELTQIYKHPDVKYLELNNDKYELVAHYEFTQEDVFNKINSIIADKLAKRDKQKFFGECFLLIHTQEMFIEPEKYIKLLSCIQFDKGGFDKVFLIWDYSYDYEYPLIELT